MMITITTAHFSPRISKTNYIVRNKESPKITNKNISNTIKKHERMDDGSVYSI